MSFDDNSSRREPVLSVLVVEDNVDHQLLIGYGLRVGIPQAKPAFVLNNQEAVRFLDQCEDGELPFPRLILLDLHFPQPEDGWQLLAYLQTHYSSIPVVVLSAHQDEDTVRQAYDLGAHSFLAKPYFLPDWEAYFKTLQTYWFQTVTLPPAYRNNDLKRT